MSKPLSEILIKSGPMPHEKPSLSSQCSEEVATLAEHFARILADNLSEQQVADCAAAQEAADQGICALHDVCDPNQYMLDALAATFPQKCAQDGSFDYDPSDEGIGPLIDLAWPIGRAKLFAQKTAVEQKPERPSI